MLKNLYKYVGLFDFLFPCLHLFPCLVLDRIAHEIVRKGTREIKKLGFPHHLTFFVTNKCNLRCAHCFYTSQLNNNTGEMSVEQIKRLAMSMDEKLRQVVLTGGEPFLRQDFVEICSAFEKFAGVKTITIMTNGFLPDKVETDVLEIINRTAMKLNFQISIDGPPSVHDINRGRQGAFDKAIQTIRRLQRLRSGGRIQRITTATALSRANIGYLEDTIQELRKLRRVLHGFTFVRGSSRNTKGVSDLSLLSRFNPDDSIFLSIEQMKEAIRKLDNKLWQLTRPNLYYATNKMLLKLIVKFSEEGLRDVRCMAGIADFTLYPNGDVALCEMLKPFGNVRDYDFDMQKFWAQEYEVYRKKVKGCRCTHDCNIMSMIKFGEKELKTLFKEV